MQDISICEVRENTNYIGQMYALEKNNEGLRVNNQSL